MTEPLLRRRLRTGGITVVLGLLTVGIGALFVSVGTAGHGGQLPVLASVVMVGVPLLLVAALVSLTRVEVVVMQTTEGPNLEVRYAFGFVTQRFPATTIVSATATMKSMVEMGGWGYRGSLRLFRYAALVTRSGAALELRLTNGRRFVVTVDEPERFAEVLAKP
jgi:hypothetical protein